MIKETEQGDEDQYIYIIERDDFINGLYGIQGIYKEYEDALIVLKSLTNNFKNYKNCESWKSIITKDVNVTILMTKECKDNSFILLKVKI